MSTTATEKLAQRQLDALLQAEAVEAERAAACLTASERAQAIREAEAARCAVEAHRCTEQAACHARQLQDQALADNRQRRLASLRAGIAANQTNMAAARALLDAGGLPAVKQTFIEAQLVDFEAKGVRMHLEVEEIEATQ